MNKQINSYVIIALILIKIYDCNTFKNIFKNNFVKLLYIILTSQIFSNNPTQGIVLAATFLYSMITNHNNLIENFLEKDKIFFEKDNKTFLKPDNKNSFTWEKKNDINGYCRLPSLNRSGERTDVESKCFPNENVIRPGYAVMACHEGKCICSVTKTACDKLGGTWKENRDYEYLQIKKNNVKMRDNDELISILNERYQHKQTNHSLYLVKKDNKPCHTSYKKNRGSYEKVGKDKSGYCEGANYIKSLNNITLDRCKKECNDNDKCTYISFVDKNNNKYIKTPIRGTDFGCEYRSSTADGRRPLNYQFWKKADNLEDCKENCDKKCSIIDPKVFMDLILLVKETANYILEKNANLRNK